MDNQLYRIHGIPQDANDSEIRKLHSRLIRDVEKFIQQTEVDKLSITISTDIKNEQNSEFNKEQNEGSINSELSFEKRALQYSSQQPSYGFSHLEIAGKVRDDLITAIDAISVESTVFDAWGLRNIQPNPRTILNFYGPPGTGKTLAAHAIADYLDKPILLVSY
ncbi:MAG: AAA family ATPase, partial [Symploca sp. SIO2G7]|nr:AAA family ATPase [Symploca sp. SIO2G7]